MLVDTFRISSLPPAAPAAPVIPATMLETAWPARVVIVAENSHGEVVERRVDMDPNLPAFARLLADLRLCGYRGIVLRRMGR